MKHPRFLIEDLGKNLDIQLDHLDNFYAPRFHTVLLFALQWHIVEGVLSRT